MKRTRPLRRGALVLGLLAAAGTAQIKSLTLEEMVDAADNSLYGQITSSRVFKEIDAEHGALYFTELTLQGRSLYDDTAVEAKVLFYGGYITPEDGVDNSESPSSDDVKIGNNVVAFYRWADDAGAGVSGNFLYQAHGGVFRTAESPRGTMVLGRGEGYAVDQNVRLDYLGESVNALYRDKVRRRENR